MRRILPDFAIITLLLALPLLFFASQTFGGQTLTPVDSLYQFEPHATYREVVRAPDVPANHLISDLILQNYQWKHFIREQLSQGELPLWNPHQFGGIPFLAAAQNSALYPLSIVYYIMDLPAAFGWFTVLNLWLAGSLMYAFLRGLGVGRAGAMLGAVVYQFNGFFIASIAHQMITGAVTWLPLLLLMVEFTIRQQKLLGRRAVIPWVALGALALMLNILAGHIEITIYTLLMAAFYAGLRLLWSLWQERDLPQFLWRAAWLLGMVALGFALASLQFIPLLDFVQTNWRMERNDVDLALSYARVPRDLLQFLLPNFYGSPTHQSYFDVFNFELVTSWPGPQRYTEWGIKNYVEGALYIGILPLLLSAFALFDRWLLRRRDNPTSPATHTEPPYRLIFAALAVLSLTFMFGLPTYRLLYLLPGINQLNTPFRWVYALALCVAVLAAFGLDALLQQRENPKQARSWPRRIGIAITSIALLTLIALGLSYVMFESIKPGIIYLINVLANAERAFHSAEMFYSYQFGMVLVLGLMLLASGILFIKLSKPHPHNIAHRTAWAGFAVGLVALDLMLAYWGFNVSTDAKLLDFKPPVVEWLQQQAGDYRFTTLQDQAQPHILPANVAMMYGLDDIRGYDSIIPAQTVNYMRLLAIQGDLIYNRIAPLYTSDNFAQSLDSPLFHLLNVKYVVSHKSITVPFQQWRLPYEDEAVRVWENPSAVPRAYTVRAEDFQAGWLADDFTGWQFTIPEYEARQIGRDTGREKLIDVQTEQATWLIVSESYAPGWRAFVRPIAGTASDEIANNNEVAYDVQRVFANFQAVQLPPGAWTVRLVYSPASFQVGLFGSVVSLVLLLLLLGIWFWRLYVGTNTDASSTTARVARNSVAPIILNLFNRGIDFAFAIVMLRLLDQSSVGVYNFAVVVFVWFDIFTNFGLDAFLIREVSRLKAQSGYYFLNASLLRLLLAVLGLPLLLLFLAFWQSSAAEPLPAAGMITLVLLYLGLFPATLSKGMTALFYAHEQAEKPAAIATITSINKAVFGVIALLLGWGIVGLAAISIANNVLTLLLLLVSGRKLIGTLQHKRPDRKLLRGMLGASWPLMLNHFLSMIFFQFDIIILQALKGAVVVAQYSTSYKWLLAVDIIPAFFTQALFPVMSRQARDDPKALQRTYQLSVKLLLALALPIAVGFTFLAEALTLILAGPAYLPDAAIALQIMIWSIPFGWMNSVTQYALIALNLQRYITGAFVGAVTFNIAANLLLIPQFGFQAAALVTIASQGALLLPFGLLMQRGLGQRINWPGLVWRPLLAVAAMIGVTLLLWPLQSLTALVVGSITYGVVLLALRPFSQAEIALLRPMLPQQFTRPHKRVPTNDTL